MKVYDFNLVEDEFPWRSYQSWQQQNEKFYRNNKSNYAKNILMSFTK